MWTPEVHRDTLRAMASLPDLLQRPRRHAVTFRDIVAPGTETPECIHEGRVGVEQVGHHHRDAAPPFVTAAASAACETAEDAHSSDGLATMQPGLPLSSAFHTASGKADVPPFFGVRLRFAGLQEIVQHRQFIEDG